MNGHFPDVPEGFGYSDLPNPKLAGLYKLVHAWHEDFASAMGNQKAEFKILDKIRHAIGQKPMQMDDRDYWQMKKEVILDISSVIPPDQIRKILDDLNF